MTGGRTTQKNPIDLIIDFATNSDKFKKLYYKDEFLYDEFMKIGGVFLTALKKCKYLYENGELYLSALVLPLKEFNNYKRIYVLFYANITSMRAFYLVKRYKSTRDFYDEYLDKIEFTQRNVNVEERNVDLLNEIEVRNIVDPEYYNKVGDLIKGVISPHIDTKYIKASEMKRTEMFKFLAYLYNSKLNKITYDNDNADDNFDFTETFDSKSGEYIYKFKKPDEFRHQDITNKEILDMIKKLFTPRTERLEVLQCKRAVGGAIRTYIVEPSENSQVKYDPVLW